MVLIPNLAKHFFHNLILVSVPTSWCQLESQLQEPDPEPPVITLQTVYPPNTGIDPVQHPPVHYPSMETCSDAVVDEPQLSEQISILIGIP
jgi:hypothetical protein